MLDIPASSIRLSDQQGVRGTMERHTTRLATLITMGFTEELLILGRLVISRQFNRTPRSRVKAGGSARVRLSSDIHTPSWHHCLLSSVSYEGRV